MLVASCSGDDILGWVVEPLLKGGGTEEEKKGVER